MAYEYDRFEREDGGGSFLMGLLAGTVLGAGLGMLFAPKPGSEIRTRLSEQAGKLRTTAADGYQQATGKVTQMVDRGREAYDRARTTGGGAAGDSSTGSLPGAANPAGGTSDTGSKSGGRSGSSGNRL
ncbi:MAG: YtxH domain-containing protein [Acidobacteriota bacterium]|nr:YtxH domain-containing protein [Acidobacteriota bacterium]